MASSTPVPLFYVPWSPKEPGGSIDQAGLHGAHWLMDQPGNKLVLVAELGDYRQLPMAEVTRGATIAKHHAIAGWYGGPVLAPWATEEILGDLSDDLNSRATAVCVIPWGDDPLAAAWLRARRAVSVLDESVYPGADDPFLDAVVEAAMIDLGKRVWGAPLTGTNRDLAVRALQLLREYGHAWDVDQLCGWALAHGFTGAQERTLRDFATQVEQGHQFRVSGEPWDPGAIDRWRAAS